jgi:hypothetical protein
MDGLQAHRERGAGDCSGSRPYERRVIGIHATAYTRPAKASSYSLRKGRHPWAGRSITHRTTPAREREQTCATEAEFERAVKYALDWTRLISATLPDGTVLDESELRRRYGPAQQPRKPT